MNSYIPPQLNIKRRERDAVLQSLQAGLVPRIGGHLIQVGRKREIESLFKDIERIKDGGSAFRLAVGNYGAGKSFFLGLCRSVALQNNLVVASADLAMGRRFHSKEGQAQALYAELMCNLAIKTKPDGDALRNICEGWIAKIKTEVTASGGGDEAVKQRILADLTDLHSYVGGFEFSEVLAKYYEGYVAMNDVLQSNALRWLKGGYQTRTESRNDLGVRRIIDDSCYYDSIKMLARFVRKAGYGGMMVCFDEAVVLSHRISNKQAKEANYEMILTMFNDCYQGSAQGVGILLAGTTEFLEDGRRGLYSYAALKTRLVSHTVGKEQIVDFSSPVLKLATLTPEELFVLLCNITHVHANGIHDKWLLSQEAIHAFLEHSHKTLGASSFKTPRDIVRAFVTLLNVLEQNPSLEWQALMGQCLSNSGQSKPSAEEEIANGVGVSSEEDMSTFKLG